MDITVEALEQLFLTRQSCRKFCSKAVENEKLIKIVEMARLAPSACNSQPWSFNVVNGTKSALVAKAVQEMGMNKFTEGCPAFIVVVEESASLLEKVGMKFKNQDFVSNDLGLAVSQAVLAATSLGLSTCILGMLSEKKLGELLGIKAKRIRLVIAVGYADETDVIREKKRKPLDKILTCHFD